MLIAQWDYFSQDFNYELSGESYGSIAQPKQGGAEKVDGGWLTGTLHKMVNDQAATRLSQIIILAKW